MPLQIQRSALVYRLWDDADLKELFADHIGADWLTTLTYVMDNGEPDFRLTMQNSKTRQIVTATLSDVIVSDFVTVMAQTVSEYNAANPEHTIEELGS